MEYFRTLMAVSVIVSLALLLFTKSSLVLCFTIMLSIIMILSIATTMEKPFSREGFFLLAPTVVITIYLLIIL